MRGSLKLAVMIVTVAMPGVAWAQASPPPAERKRCLSVDERKLSVMAQKAVPLSRAIRAAKAKTRGEVVRARLCEQGSTLVYVLTVLGRDGRVSRLRVDASSGTVASGR